MKVEYLQSGSLADLQRQVNAALANDWVLRGNLITWTEIQDNRNPTYALTWFVQAVTYDSLTVLREVKT